MRQMPGNKLTDEARRNALARFVHRYTRDHKPSWVAKETPVQFASDADWLAHTLFWVRKDGSIAERPSHCESTPTWPDNPELR